MATGAEIVDWIDENTDIDLVDWQRELIMSAFASGYPRTVISVPRRQGMSSMTQAVQRAIDAVPA